jgi:hypothetical protein
MREGVCVCGVQRERKPRFDDAALDESALHRAKATPHPRQNGTSFRPAGVLTRHAGCAEARPCIGVPLAAATQLHSLTLSLSRTLPSKPGVVSRRPSNKTPFCCLSCAAIWSSRARRATMEHSSASSESRGSISCGGVRSKIG